MVADQFKRFAFARSGGLFDRAGECFQLTAQVRLGNQVESRGEDRRFEDGMTGAMEADEIADSTAVNNLGFEPCSLGGIVTLDDLELVPTAAVLKDTPVDGVRGHRVRDHIQSVQSGSRDQQHIVRDVEDSTRSLFQILVRRRSLKRTEREVRERLVHDRTHRREIQLAREVKAGDESFDKHGSLAVAVCYRPVERT